VVQAKRLKMKDTEQFKAYKMGVQRRSPPGSVELLRGVVVYLLQEVLILPL
jgi:hypothetical protein